MMEATELFLSEFESDLQTPYPTVERVREVIANSKLETRRRLWSIVLDEGQMPTTALLAKLECECARKIDPAIDLSSRSRWPPRSRGKHPAREAQRGIDPWW